LRERKRYFEINNRARFHRKFVFVIWPTDAPCSPVRPKDTGSDTINTSIPSSRMRCLVRRERPAQACIITSVASAGRTPQMHASSSKQLLASIETI
jgi:hypothetical protein